MSSGFSDDGPQAPFDSNTIISEESIGWAEPRCSEELAAVESYIGPGNRVSDRLAASHRLAHEHVIVRYGALLTSAVAARESRGRPAVAAEAMLGAAEAADVRRFGGVAEGAWCVAWSAAYQGHREDCADAA